MGDHLDYMNQQQQQADALRRFNEQFTKEPVSPEEVVRSQALTEAVGVAEQADAQNDDLLEMVQTNRALRRQIEAGTVDIDTAKATLAELRSRHNDARKQTTALRSRHARVSTTLKDPAAVGEALVAKYPALRRD